MRNTEKISRIELGPNPSKIGCISSSSSTVAYNLNKSIALFS